jgi:hypothetical protein
VVANLRESGARRSRWVALALSICLGGCGRPEVVPNTPVELNDVPQAVLTAAKKKFPDAKVTTACKTPSGDFELYSQTKRGKLHLLTVSESGQIIDAE